jgi:TadE-like protein
MLPSLHEPLGCKTRRRRLPSIWRRFRRTDGANLVEAALILPPILFVIFGLMEFAGILYAKMALQNGVSQASRFAITRSVLPGKTRKQSIIETLQRETPTLTIDPNTVSFHHLEGGAWVPDEGPADSIERLTVVYEWDFMTPFVDKFFPSETFTITVESAMKNEGDSAQL